MRKLTMTARKVVVRRLMVLAILSLGTASAAAQTPAQSFADLQSALKAGQRIAIIEEKGILTTITTGEVVSITADKLEIRQRLLFFLDKQYVFTEQSVSQIQSAHAIWKGGVIGGAVGVLTALAIGHTRDSNPEQTGFFVSMGLLGGAWMGHSVEEMKQHRLLYVSPLRKPTTHMRPPRAAITATVRF